jgi:uncharacterized FAD-dependent dehydrogenase
MKIAIIGFGAAAIGFIERIKNSNNEIHIFEKSKDIYSSSISGIRADGKLFVSNEMGGNIDVDIKLQKQFVNYYIDKTEDKKYEKGSSFAKKEYYNKFYKKGFQPIHSDFYHIGTDQLKQVLYNIYKGFKKLKNIHFHFEAPILDIEPIDNTVILNKKDSFDMVVVAVGRSGHKLVKNVIGKFPELISDNTKVDLGVRMELPDLIVEELNSEMYEFKVKYKSKTGYMVRTFCNNPSGFVVTENYDDFATVNGHSKLKGKSKNTNFAILTTVQLTQPFNDPIGYGSRRIAESIIDFIENLNEVVPGVANDDNLLYAPEIKFYSNRLYNDHFHNLKFIGDCSGATRSIIYATAHGWMMAEKIINS